VKPLVRSFARAPRPRAGFTLVEILAAMMILLLGMASVLGLLAFGAAMARNAALKGAGASAVEAVVADLEETFFPLVRDESTGDMRAGEPAPVKDRPVPGNPGLTYSASGVPDPLDDTPGGARRWRVEVVIRWTAGGEQKTKTFKTLLLRQVPFGERLRRELLHGDPPATSEGAHEAKT
jgi:prepilin-type N-terminal cleavage/methylation domain-containing protein